MNRGTIIEVTSWDYDATGLDSMQDIAEYGAGGVVIKASQGTDWMFTHLPMAIREAKQGGLLVGVLHYAEPGLNAPELEADHLMGALPDDDLPLGLWLELDDLGGRQGYEMADWVQSFLDRAMTPRARSVLCCAPELYAEMAGAPWGRHWVATAKLATDQHPWAQRIIGEGTGLQDESDGWTTSYQLTSLRGLNAPESGTRAIVPPVVPEPPEAPTGAATEPSPEVPETPTPEPDDDVN